MFAVMLGLGAIFFRICSLFLRAMSSFTNQLDLQMILLIFQICFFFRSSLIPWIFFLFQLSSLTLLKVFPRELLLAAVFLIGDSFKEMMRGFKELLTFCCRLGMMLRFSLVTAIFFFSFSFLMVSQVIFSSISLRYFYQLLRQFRRQGILSLFFLKRMLMAKMNPLVYRYMRHQRIWLNYF